MIWILSSKIEDISSDMGQFIGGELVHSLAVFRARHVVKRAEIICAGTLCDERVACWQGFPRTAEQVSGAGAFVAEVVRADGVGVELAFVWAAETAVLMACS